MRNSRRSFAYCAVAALLSSSVGCGVGPQIAANSALLPLEGGCPENASEGFMDFSSEVSKLRLQVSGASLDEPMSVEGSVGQITLEGIPVGDNLQVTLYGIDDTGAATWRGIQQGVSVEADRNVSIDLLLSKVADLSCPRSPLSNQRSFHSATALADGRVLLIGGADDSLDASGEGAGARRLTATATTEIYDPALGTFSPAGPLNVARMMHTATLLPDGRVAVFGGVGEVVTLGENAGGSFPIKPKTTPISVIEVWSPDSGAFSTVGEDPWGPRMFHAATLTDSGELLVTGGIPGLASPHNLSNALRGSTRCDTASLSCQRGPDMVRARAGHSTTLLANGNILVWGGSVETGTADAGAGYKPEMWRGNEFVGLNPIGFSNSPVLNPFFASATEYTNNRVVAGGGLTRLMTGTFELSEITDEQIQRGPVFIFDATSGSDGQISAGPYGGPSGNVLDPLRLADPRFMGSVVSMSGNRAVFSGGFSTLSLTPSSSLDVFSEQSLDVEPIYASGQPRLLREARGALTATSLGNGSILISGGEIGSSSGHRPCASAEIFTDPVEPGAPK